jgi:hypothetical protein
MHRQQMRHRNEIHGQLHALKFNYYTFKDAGRSEYFSDTNNKVSGLERISFLCYLIQSVSNTE